jgi:2-(1,2-epoxy-1,2-dihydrophenyl)acetyl-CoA isomerase
MSDSLRIEVTDFVAVVEVNRPPANHFDLPTMTALADALDELDADPACRVVVLASVGKHFCAGLDFAALSDGEDATLAAQAFYAQATRLFEAQTPIVAAVQGSAVGGGLGLACAADFRVADVNSRFVANFAKLGIHHGFALSVSLPAIVGQQAASDMLLTGRRITGERALQIGLADRLSEPGEQRAMALVLANEIAASAPLAVRSIRQTMRAGLADRVRAALVRELAEQRALLQTGDAGEGIAASLARRAPVFTGE